MEGITLLISIIASDIIIYKIAYGFGYMKGYDDGFEKCSKIWR